MKGFLLFATLVVALSTSAQTVTIKKIELAGEKVIVHYDLEDNSPGREYQLSLYASKDNYSTPLTKVKGDVGAEVKPGTDRKIEWAVREEYGPYKGKIALEIKGSVFVAFVKFQDFGTDRSYKRGKSYNLNLKSGSANPIHVELYKGSQRVGGEMNHPNNGAYSLSVPSNAKPGKDYRIKISDSKNSEAVVYSPYFKVKPKLPLLVKVLPVLAIGGAVAALAGGSKGGGGEETGGSQIPVPDLPN
jgi:Ser-Thr-rich glycosyl-phosphatidyl-inositol-anchored membrane family